jgi:transcriptional regulator with XRE-family HTH domain/ribosomal protein S30
MHFQQDHQPPADVFVNPTGHCEQGEIRQTLHVCTSCHQPEMPLHPLIPCAYCPRTYHLACLPPDFTSVGPNWRCPHHRCNVCLMTSSPGSPDGILCQCTQCLGLYCLEHVPPHSQRISNLEAVSYIPAAGVILINCGHCETLLQRRRHQYSALQLRTNSDKVPRILAAEKLHSSPRRRNSDADTKRRNDSLSMTTEELDGLSETERRNKELVEQYNFAAPDDCLRATIKELASQRAITQRELADYVGVSKSTISKYLNGKLKGTGIKSVEPKLSEWLENYYEELRKNEFERKQQRLKQLEQVNKVYSQSPYLSNSYLQFAPVYTQPVNVIASVNKVAYANSSSHDNSSLLSTPLISLTAPNVAPLMTCNPPTLVINECVGNPGDGVLSNPLSYQASEIDFDLNSRESDTFENRQSNFVNEL